MRGGLRWGDDFFLNTSSPNPSSTDEGRKNRVS